MKELFLILSDLIEAVILFLLELNQLVFEAAEHHLTRLRSLVDLPRLHFDRMIHSGVAIAILVYDLFKQG